MRAARTTCSSGRCSTSSRSTRRIGEGPPERHRRKDFAFGLLRARHRLRAGTTEPRRPDQARGASAGAQQHRKRRRKRRQQPTRPRPRCRSIANSPATRSRSLQRPDRTATTAVAPQSGDPTAPRPVIRIGQIEILRGNVNFTDNFIKPNYTANMTGLGGTVTTLASDSTEPATMTLAGKIDDDAPVDISGRLNPLAPKLFLDIKGSTKGVDLPRLTPYSVKYAGYPIVKGKLSMDVQLQDRGREAQREQSPVPRPADLRREGGQSNGDQAAGAAGGVAADEQSKGEIDINLPISGTLNDPEVLGRRHHHPGHRQRADEGRDRAVRAARVRVRRRRGTRRTWSSPPAAQRSRRNRPSASTRSRRR